MPNVRTVTRWIEASPDLASKCALARQIGAEHHTLKLQEITRRVEDGTLTPEQARVISSNLIWFASKLNPKVYGDKLQTENNHKITVQVEYSSSPSLPDSVIDAEFSEPE